MEKLYNSIYKLREGLLSYEAKQAFENVVQISKVKKGALILKENDICSHMYSVKSGLLRQFFYKDGIEITEFFARENEGCFCIESYLEEKPSKILIEALEDSIISSISKNDFEELCKKYWEIELFYRKIFETSLILSQRRMYNMLFETAHERYNIFLKDKPGLVNRVPSIYIASYLGITRETLSRVRAH
jgi:CRP-like cAMP-binding protein